MRLITTLFTTIEHNILHKSTYMYKLCRCPDLPRYPDDKAKRSFFHEKAKKQSLLHFDGFAYVSPFHDFALRSKKSPHFRSPLSLLFFPLHLAVPTFHHFTILHYLRSKR